MTESRRKPAGVARTVALADTFVSLADTLVDDFDVADMMRQLVDACVELLSAEAAGLLLCDAEGRLRLAASSSEETRLIELFQLQSEQGPCLDCVATGRSVHAPEISEAAGRWPDFAAAAGSLGFTSVFATPLRLRDHVVGGLNLFGVHGPALEEADQRLAQALADMATIGLLQYRSRHHAHRLSEQLQAALDSRVVIEQAKGVLAEYARIDMESAFEVLRKHSRDGNRKLSEVANSVVRRSVSLDSLLPGPTA